MRNIKGCVVWITGASSGIGEALAHAFRKQGAHLILSARRMDELIRVQDALPDMPGAETMVLPMDVTATDSLQHLTAQVMDRLGRVDILVNNAGISQRSLVLKTPLEVDRRIMEVNFFGAVALTKAVIPHMVQKGSGHIVVVSSVSGKFGFHMRSAYSASKHALHGFFESLRLELYKHGIGVTMVCPGRIQTQISLHALTSDGTPHNQMDEGQRNGKSADALAERILKGIQRNEEELYFGGSELLAVWLKRFVPKIFTRIIRNQKPT